VSPDPLPAHDDPRGALAVVGRVLARVLALSRGSRSTPCAAGPCCRARRPGLSATGPNDFQVNTTFGEIGVDPT
jgi:hypothetical protein